MKKKFLRISLCHDHRYTTTLIYMGQSPQDVIEKVIHWMRVNSLDPEYSILIKEARNPSNFLRVSVDEDGYTIDPISNCEDCSHCEAETCYSKKDEVETIEDLQKVPADKFFKSFEDQDTIADALTKISNALTKIADAELAIANLFLQKGN